ncbi:transporter [Kineobactrum sediminis]|uniref:Transporter n=1 Tax=Kineobactrum sediminis TaxID=1905677 RepID=A0A2N5XYQ1_9GAMM|nr:VF530 family protein [Kineobactrum sediminis]PLW81252.1 transporter [Kineobactrum sediminis]
MSSEQPKNPLHGITIETALTRLVEHYGWEGLAQRIDVNCFKNDPSIKSSLTFLRKTQWARDKVERLYLSTFDQQSPWGRSR